MEQYEVDNRVLITVGVLWVSTKHVVYSSVVVETRRHLTISVIGSFAARIGQPFYLISHRAVHQSKIGVRVTSRRVVLHLDFVQPCLKPVLEVEFLVHPVSSMDKLALPDCLVTLEKYVDNCPGHVRSTCLAHSCSPTSEGYWLTLLVVRASDIVKAVISYINELLMNNTVLELLNEFFD